MESRQNAFRIGGCRVDPDQRLIEGPNGVEAVEPKVMAVLMCLVGKPKTVMTRSDLLDAVWPGASISDEVLSRAIYRARQQLGDDGRAPKIIITVPKKGYRLAVEPEYEQPSASTPGSPSQPFIRHWPALLATAGLLLAVGIWLVRSPAVQDMEDPVVSYAPGGERIITSRIAVLPFTDLSTDGSKAYFSDGLTDELMSALSRADNIGVVARTSSYVFRDSAEDARSIGRKLNADHLLQGSIMFDGDSYRVIVHLIDARDNNSLWVETYDGNLSTLFADQDQITRKIADSLEVQLAAGLQSYAALRPADNSEAYRLYLEGRYYFHKRNTGALQQAVDFFEQAVDSQPDYALAYVGISDSFVLLSQYGELPQTEALEMAYAAITRALEIDNNLAEARASLGLIQLHDGKVEEAVRELRLAASLNPNYVMAHNWLGRALRTQGLFLQELAAYRRALELDPLSPIVNMNVGMALTLAGRYDESQSRLQKAIELNPEFANAHWALAYSYHSSGNLAQSVHEYDRARSLGLEADTLLAQQAMVYLDLGDLDNAAGLLDRIRQIPTFEVTNDWGFNATVALMTSRDPAEEQLAWLGTLMAENPADASIRLEFILAALRHNDLSAAMNAAAELDIDDADTQDVLYNQWDIEAGYLHAVTLANVYRQMNLADDAGKLLAGAKAFVADARQRGINSAGADYLEATLRCLEDDNDGAFSSLGRSIERGWRSEWWTRSDPNLIELRLDDRFAGMLTDLRDRIHGEITKLDIDREGR